MFNAALTRHFFNDFFRLSFLDDAGEESFRRIIIGLLAAFVALGLWLPRVYVSKYAHVANVGPIEQYRAMLMADQLLIVSLPMFIVAFAITLVCHSLFPDETDYRILMALPVSRFVIFSAKLLALLLFASLFILTTNAAIGIPFSAASSGRMAAHFWLTRALTQTAVGIVASLFAVASIIAIQGVVVLLAPVTRLRGATVIVQTLLVCGLMLLLPLVLRLPAQSALMQERSAILYLVPPIWFLGLQEFLLGNREPYFIRLAVFALSSVAVVSTLAVGCYALVYERFDRVILRSARRRHEADGYRPLFNIISVFRPEYHAVRGFTVVTLRRSGLHQLVFLGVATIGLATSLNSLLSASSADARQQAIMLMPFVLIFASVVGLRLALLLPLNRRAAWIFRLTENDGGRIHQLRAVEHVLLTHAVLAPVALVLPLQLIVLGVRATLFSLPLIFLLGLTLVEIMLVRWHRIPFSCSYLPGKRPLPYELFVIGAAFIAFTAVGQQLSSHAVADQTTVPIALLILLTLAGVLRWARLISVKSRPLEFEDEPPESSYPLKLNT